MKTKIVWDTAKNKLNMEKHSLNFEDALFVFDSPTVAFEDDRYSYGEKRYITIGLLAQREVVIIHTPRADQTRIISMRKANARERKIYKKRLETS